jgi:DNA invertase Pin-like site-specific DNA recombinase
MAKIGYMMRFANYETADADFEWMANFGCVDVVEEQPEMEKLRPGWSKLLSGLKYGDILVIPKLSNVLRGTRQLSVFLELCRVQSIRLVSIHDKIDTAGELFTETRVADVLNIIAALPKEVNLRRKAEQHTTQLKGKITHLTEASYKRAERIKIVVNMYKEHHRLEDIMRASGFKSRDSIFRVLKEAGVQLNRSSRDYYANKPKSKDDKN